MNYFGRTKTNRLKKPRFKEIAADNSNDRVNWIGQPHAQVGDYVYQAGPAISAGTVGKIVDIDADRIERLNSQGHRIGTHYTMHTPVTIEFLDGKRNQLWLWYLAVIDASALQEVKDFYINDGRPDRIKVTW